MKCVPVNPGDPQLRSSCQASDRADNMQTLAAILSAFHRLKWSLKYTIYWSAKKDLHWSYTKTAMSLLSETLFLLDSMIRGLSRLCPDVEDGPSRAFLPQSPLLFHRSPNITTDVKRRFMQCRSAIQEMMNSNTALLEWQADRVGLPDLDHWVDARSAELGHVLDTETATPGDPTVSELSDIIVAAIKDPRSKKSE
jgi:hypothetical protein